MDVSIQSLLIYGLVILMLLKWFRWRIKKLKLFEELGIPGPPPHFLLGNLRELNEKGPIKCREEWIEKYGQIVGYYHGFKPILMVADPDLLKKIFIKDFHLFQNRPEGVPMRVRSIFDCIIPASEIMDSLLINLKGQRWKEVRSIVSQTFSANKLKTTIPAVNEISEVAVSILTEKSKRGKVINILQILQRLTLDIISAQAFAMDTDTLNNPKDPLLRSAKIIFDLPYSSKIIFFGSCFPELGFFAMALNFLSMLIKNKGNIPPLKITRVVEQIVKLRRKDPKMKRPDILQLLIDASAYSTDTDNSATNNINRPSENTNITKKRLTLTDVEIQANALVVFLAGFETTSAALAYAFYYLAKHPELQQKAHEEIDQMIQKEGKLDYYNVSNFQFLERFLLESMRFCPPGWNFVSRIASTDVDYGYVRIPKGLEIVVPVQYIHHSEEFWNFPEEFDPDRFLPGNATKNNAVGYWAFGVGPRICIGTRLVHLTSKVILAKILHKFTVIPVDSDEKIVSDIKYATMVPKKVLVKLIPKK